MNPEYLTEWVLEAVRRGDINDAQKALKQKELSERLFTAARDNDIEAAKQAIDEGAYIDSGDVEWRETPLHIAAEDGSTEVARLLIDEGATINAEDERGKTPLYRAEFWDRKETAELLKQHGGV